MQLRSAGKLLEQWRFWRPALLFLIFKWSLSVKLLAAAKGRCQACLGLLWMCLKIRTGDLLLKDLGAQHWIGGGDGCSFALADTSENLDTYQYLLSLRSTSPIFNCRYWNPEYLPLLGTWEKKLKKQLFCPGGNIPWVKTFAEKDCGLLRKPASFKKYRYIIASLMSYTHGCCRDNSSCLHSLQEQCRSFRHSSFQGLFLKDF